jgi:hypothetical protein
LRIAGLKLNVIDYTCQTGVENLPERQTSGQ